MIKNIMRYQVLTFVAIASTCASLRCRQGANLSVGGIPFLSFWMDKPCEADTNCMIQDLSVQHRAVKFAYANFTYGGCFPESIERRLSCARSTDRYITSAELDKVGAVLDSLVLEITLELMMNKDKHLTNLMSFGEGIRNFQTSILNFFESIGYDNKRDIRAAFYQYVGDFRNMDKLSKLLDLITVDNEPTRRLSAAMTRHLKRFSRDYDMPPYVLEAASTAPSVLYAITKAATDDVDDIFYEMSKTFESRDAVTSEKVCSILVMACFPIHLAIARIANLQSDGSTKLFDVISEATKNITSRCAAQYPDNEFIERIDFMGAAHISIIKETAVICKRRATSWSSYECQQLLWKAQTDMKDLYFKSMQGKRDKYSDLRYAMEDFNVEYRRVMQEFSKNPLRYWDKMFSTVIKKTRNKLLKYLHLIQDEGNEFLDEEMLSVSCYDYICKRDLCNSHAKLVTNREAKHGETTKKQEL